MQLHVMVAILALINSKVYSYSEEKIIIECAGSWVGHMYHPLLINGIHIILAVITFVISHDYEM